MFSGSRHCLRSRAFLSLTDHLGAAPKEPLLFLYPRWFTSAIGKSSPAPLREPIRRDTVKKVFGNTQSRKRTYFSTHCHCQGQLAKLEGTSETPLTQGPTFHHSAKEQNFSYAAESQDTGKADHRPAASPVESSPSASKSFHDITACDGPQAQNSPIDASNDEERLHEVNRSDQTLEIPPKIQYNMGLLRRRESVDKYKAIRNLRTRIKHRDARSLDWRTPLEILLGKSWVRPRRRNRAYEKRISVAEEVIHNFAGDINENVWELPFRSGCEVHVLDQKHSDGLGRSVVLRGSPRAIELAERHLGTFSSDVHSKPSNLDFSIVPFVPSRYSMVQRTQDVPKLRAVWTSLRQSKHQLRPHQVRADHILRPETWTVKSFADYIETLTTSFVSRSMHRHLYKHPEHHSQVVEQIIRELFIDHDNASFISSRALNLALEFLYRHNSIPTAQLLFVKLEDMRVTMVTETFNIALRDAAKRKNLRSFTFFLELMRQRGVQPDLRTWMALLKAAPSGSARSMIALQMRQHGLLLQPAAVKALNAQLLQGELSAHLESGQDLESFFKLRNQRYESNWLSKPAMHQMINVLARRGSWEQVYRILNFCRGLGISPDSTTLNQLLSQCRGQRDLKAAIQTTFILMKLFHVDEDALTLQILFKIAWDSMRHNLCRILWRYACMEGVASYMMQSVVYTSLITNTPSDPKGVYRRWKLSAGKVIVGLNIDKTIIGDRYKELEAKTRDRRGESPMACLVGIAEQGKMRDHQLDLAKLMLGKDLAAVKKFEPTRDFVGMLREAYFLDQEWVKHKVLRDQSTIWMLENAIEVPVRRRIDLSGEASNKPPPPTAQILGEDESYVIGAATRAES